MDVWNEETLPNLGGESESRNTGDLGQGSLGKLILGILYSLSSSSANSKSNSN